MLNPFLNQESLKQPEVESFVIDGQDGSGKGTVADIIAERCAEAGANVVKIAYPAYHLPWGKFIRTFLSPDPKAPRPEIRDKMLAYALNRLETTPAILSMVDILKNQNKPINLIFDRFITSNVLTLAYDAVNRQYAQTLSKDSIRDHYNYMLEIDSLFTRLLHLENWSAWIPLVPQEESMKRMTADNTRSSLDLHENGEVQQTAAGIYRVISEIDTQVNVFDQYIPEERRHMTAFEVADRIRPRTDLAEIDWSNSGRIYTLYPPENTINSGLVESVLNRYGSNSLKDEFRQFKSGNSSL